MSDRTLPPVGQVIGAWTIAGRIPNTRSWTVRCNACQAERSASGVVVGRALVDPTNGLTDCGACGLDAAHERTFDLDGVADPDVNATLVWDPAEPGAEIVLEPAAFDALSARLDDPARVLPGLVDLMARPSPFIMYNPDELTFASDPVVPTEQAMRALILAKMADSTRSAQAAPGPSEIGGCERRLAHRMVYGAKDRREDASAWRPQVGTFGHTGLAGWFGPQRTEDFNTLRDGLMAQGEPSRWMPDVRVTSPIAGTLDLYDRATSTVIDFKFVGITTLKAARKGQISDKYRTQLALYGLGMAQAGHDVKTLALWFLPSAGSLDDAHYEEWSYDERVAWAAVAKRDRIAAVISEARAEGSDPASILPLMSTTEDYCRSCPALGAHCSGAKGDVKPGSLGLELVR